MPGLPLIKDYSPGATLLWCAGSTVTQGQLLSEALALSERLPPSRYLLNICDSRYTFIVGFVAALLTGRTSLLPPNRLAATLDDLRNRYPEAVLISDSDDAGAIRLSAPLPTAQQAAAWPNKSPIIDADHIAAIAFTSGSTGAPQPNVKTWRNLVMTVGYAAERLHMRGRQIVGTVPPQHMYGLETTVMPALAGGAAVCAERPLFPEDLRRALASVPEPRLLITTPVHLHSFLQACLRYPTIERIVSATAPLSSGLSIEAEQQLQARIDEIYGCTEAGSIATRHTRDGDLWTPYPDARVRDCDEGAMVDGPHLAEPVRLADVIQIEGDGRFRLLGRSNDMIKVAGKRASLHDLTQKLLAIAGVEDAVIFVPQPDAAIARPAALVIAPTRSEAELLEAMSKLVDPVFLPRPLRKVDKLPRNAVGKLPRSALLELLA
jgi:acyl-coenzyme A synthetase/AMP-(fatty) acid ligase